MASALESRVFPPGYVNWLFLDLNSYFASVEQEVRPELRNRPIAVVPVVAETTCCIAASYEAKAVGVRTGTGVKDAKQMCPGLVLVKARQELYVQYHHKIVKAVDSCVPVKRVASIDEMACELMGRECVLSNAIQLAKKVKQAIREQAGETLRCSIGLAPNGFLAKVASNMEKPDGLQVIQREQLPQILYGLAPADIPGIGPRMNQRLERWGIKRMEQLCALSSAQMGDIWGSVVGKRVWHWLRGDDFEEASSTQKSVGHQHVLPPEMRTMEQAGAIGQKLLHKAAVRLRRMHMWARGVAVHVSFSPWRERRFWESHTRILECQDTATLLGILQRIWQNAPAGKPILVGVTLYDLIPDHHHTLCLFNEDSRTDRLANIMDTVNARFGNDTLYLGGIHHTRGSAPTCAAFSKIPDLEDF